MGASSGAKATGEDSSLETQWDRQPQGCRSHQRRKL